MKEENNGLKNFLQRNSDKLSVIGIDGLSRSGKTTYVNELGKMLEENHTDYMCLHMDDYIEKRNKRYNTGFEEWKEYYYLQWDVEYLRKNMFAKLKNFSRLTLQYYDNESDVHVSKTMKLPSSGVILIEGVFLQRKEWKGFFDYLIYLDCERETRFRRESEYTQTQTEKFKKRYWKAEDYYMKSVQPAANADYVIKT
ncbi:kinase [Bacillus sp. Marseille-Q1617]|uniref:kinase n=1 Tax=Bacillus sp. Marseille-Q1617 TaxID=2736887 RepID=UPI001589DF32|nr:kinase [Bacillus sp. Marseille-Q1617]